MHRSPLISVVIATYNMGQYLPLALDSALRQSYPSLDVIVVDDGSTDDSVEALRPFLDDPRVRYIRQENAGQASAKNRGIGEARGELVAFLDADDVWLPDKIARQIPLFENPSVGVVYCRSTEIDGEGRAVRLLDFPLYRGQVSGPMLVFNFIGFSTSVVRKACFDEMGGLRNDLGMGIDYDLWLRMSARYHFDFVDAPLVGYRVWPGQMSKNVERRYQNGIRIMKDFLAANPQAVGMVERRHAWAHTYSGYGDSLRSLGIPSRALGNYVRSLGHWPTYLPAWKGLVKLALGIR